MQKLLSLFAKEQTLLHQTDNQLVFENSSLRRLRQLIVFILLLFLALDLVYLFAGTWSLAGTCALAIPSLTLFAFSNLKGRVCLSQNEIENTYQYFLLHKNKTAKLHTFPYMLVREVLNDSISYDKNPTPSFMICFAHSAKSMNEETDICLHNVHLHDKEMGEIAKILAALKAVVKRNPIFYKRNDVAMDADINKLEKHYQEIA